MTIIHFDLSENRDIKKVCKAAFPGYNGRKFQVNFGVKKMSLRSYWSGGSRTYYALVRMSDLEVNHAPDSHPVFNNVPYNVDSVEIPEGFVVVSHRIFCGKDLGLTIHTPFEAPVLESGNSDENSEDLAILLIATRSRKSSYGGIKDYRKYTLMKTMRWSSDYVDQLRKLAMEKGYMQKNKALSNAGKNIANNHPKKWMSFYS